MSSKKLTFKEATASKTSSDTTLRSLSAHSVQNNQPPGSVVLQQCCHLIQIQDLLLQKALEHRKDLVVSSKTGYHQYEELHKELEAEKIAHAETLQLLSTEQEKAVLALTEVQVLSKQLDREKSTFEHAFGLLKSQALSDSSKSEDLVAKCSALESLIASKDESIARLQGQVHELTERIREMKQTHKMELQEADVRTQQERYLARHLGTTTSSRTHPVKGRTKLKSKEF